MERPYGPGGEEKRKGTKHFRAGAKVVCVRFFWDGPLTNIMVIGRHRASNRFILIAVRADWLANWRVELVYSPRIIQLINEYVSEHNLVCPQLDGTEESKAKAEEVVTGWLPKAFGSKEQPHVSTRSNKSPES